MKARKAVWGILAVLLATGLTTGALAGEQHQEKDYTRVFVMSGPPRLGAQVSDLTAEKAQELNLAADARGVVIEKVEEESPAAKAGLQAQDVLLSFDGERLRSVRQLRRLVQETPANREVPIEFSRNGRTQTARATLEDHAHARLAMPPMPAMPGIPVPPTPPTPHVEIPNFNVYVWNQGPRLGISGDELTPQLGEFFGVEPGKGVLVREVMAGTAADRAGLKAGDVILRVDDQETNSIGELRRALSRQGAEKEEEKDLTVTLTFVRDRRQQTVQVTLDAPRHPSSRYVTGVTVDLDREALEEWKEEWEAEMSRWQEELQEAEREWREALESEEFQREMQHLQNEMRWEFRYSDDEVVRTL